MVPSTLGDPSGYATALHNKFAQSSVNGSLSETQSLVKSSEGPWIASSSSSAQDLYPISKSWCHEPQFFYHEYETLLTKVHAVCALPLLFRKFKSLYFLTYLKDHLF